MAGEVWEWTMDYYAAYINPCTDCAALQPAPLRVYRGGDFGSDPQYLLPQNRGGDFPSNRFSGMGFRCARPP
jgi:formylglycine-generating enzyme required for sulfatase activity